MPNTIENYSEVFLKTVLEFTEFRHLFISNWNPEYFDTTEERIFYKVIRTVWINDHKILTKKDLILEFTTKSKYEKIRMKLVEVVERVYSLDLSEYTESFVRDQFLDILRKKKLQSAVQRIVEEVSKSGKVDESAIKGDIIKSLDIEDHLQDLGINYYEGDLLNRMKVLQELQVAHFKTGFNADLDDVLRLKRKTVVAVSAQLGVGKSLFLNNLAINMSLEGHNILYLSLEMDAFDISKRLDRIALGFHEDEYFKSSDLVLEKMDEVIKENPKHGKLFIRSYSPRSLSAFQIRTLLETYRMKNIGIDVILVDYLTLMRPNNNRKDDTMYQRGKDITEELQSVAKDERCLIFTALQVKNEAYGKKKQGSELVAESLAIPQILDSLINMREIIIDESDKFFILHFEKVRDSKKTNKMIFLKLKDNLRMVSVTEEERKNLEELTNKRKTVESNKTNTQTVDLDVL
jgi:replicative DNA helicase